jgi:trehalose 6-phosphate phosphatase
MIKEGFAVPPSPALPPPSPIEATTDALFLDLDGTLAPIRRVPDEVVVAVDMLDALASARRALAGRVAVVSGRSIATLDALLGCSDYSLAGIHGLERRTVDGMVLQTVTSPGLRAARDKLAQLAEREPRLLIEDKGLGIAVHYRSAPELEDFARREASAIAELCGLAYQTGKMVAEVRERGGDKGTALQAFMQEAPFAGARPIFVGDDDTDEAGFAAAEALGGFGVLVGRPRTTAARFALPDVDRVRDWLHTAGGNA